jgi:Flp pilus assembly protein TadB
MKHRVHKREKNKTKQKQSRETGNIGYTRRRKTKQSKNNPEKLAVASFSGLFLLCFVFLRIVYPMLPVSLDWFCFVLFFFVLCTLCCQFLWIVFVLYNPEKLAT